MLAVGGEGRRAAAGLQSVQHGVDLGLAEYRLLEWMDMTSARVRRADVQKT